LGLVPTPVLLIMISALFPAFPPEVAIIGKACDRLNEYPHEEC